MSYSRIVAGALAFLGAAFALWFPSKPRAAERCAGLTMLPAISAGDVVFFRTTTWRGSLVRLLQENGDDFTHAGIVVDAASNDVRVAHACPVEPAIVRIDRLSDLLAKDEITSVAIYRPRVRRAEALKATMIAEDYAARQIAFDFEFDLADDHAVYCTELIWLSYRIAGLKFKASRNIIFPADLVHTGFFEPLATWASR